MARIVTRYQFDQTEFDLSALALDGDDVPLFENDVNGPVHGPTVYEDLYTLSQSWGRSVLAGTGFAVDDAGVLTDGTVTGYYDLAEGLAGSHLLLAVQGISLSAKTLLDAAQSIGLADDRAVINAALAGADRFDLGEKDDIAYGRGGNDFLLGNGGDDRLFGNAGDDRLHGNRGDDTLRGGVGDDKLQGGLGRDLLWGQAGEDRFIFTKLSDTGVTGRTADIIRDFQPGIDKIDLRMIDARDGGSDDAFVFRGMSAFSGSGGELRVSHVRPTGDTTPAFTMVWLDTDGDPAAEAAIRLSGIHTLQASDFLF